MSKIIKIIIIDDAYLLYLFNYILIGIINKRDEGIAKGIVIGIWRFQLQITIGYSDKLNNISEVGHA
tara:strand:+ start:3179 stop:3379 length:201 start_codon:yes stop_codon:yes gene_type:complete